MPTEMRGPLPLNHKHGSADSHEVDGATSHADRQQYPARVFSHTDGASVDEDGSIVSNPNAKDGIVVFGPYARLAAGRYRVSPRVDVLEFTKGASRLHTRVNDADAGAVIAARRMMITDAGLVSSPLDFSLERETRVEFRIDKHGAIRFRHRGATLWLLDQFAPEKIAADGLEQELPAHAFFVSAPATRDPDGNIVSHPQTPDGNVVYGPYITMPAGRYRVRHHIRILGKPQHESSIEADVSAGHSILAVKRLKISEPGWLHCSLDFVLSHDAVVEFRINKQGRTNFRHSGAVIRTLGEDESFEPSLLPEEPAAATAKGEDLAFSETNEIAIAPAEFSLAQQTAHVTTDGIVAHADSADGTVIYGPYVRVPPGRYRIHPHINVEQRPGQGAQLGLDIYAPDQRNLIVERWVEIAHEGPVASPMTFALDRETLLEFRVRKKGPVGFRHAGATLRRLNPDEPFNASPAPSNDTVNRPSRRFGGSWLRRFGL